MVQPISHETSSAGGPIVYIVDGDASVRRSVRSLFGVFGFEVRDYASAEAFLEHFCGTRPGCVITEERLDGMSGLQLQRQLQQLGAVLPVIIMTSDVDAGLSTQATQTGVRALIQKPFVDRILLDRVQQTLGHSDS